MERPVPNERRQPRVKEQAAEPARLRRGGSVTLPAGASDEEIDNALRNPAAEEESK